MNRCSECMEMRVVKKPAIKIWCRAGQWISDTGKQVTIRKTIKKNNVFLKDFENCPRFNSADTEEEMLHYQV